MSEPRKPDLLRDRPGATCPPIPESLVDEIAAALGIPRERLDVDRSGIAILAERKPEGRK